MSYYTEEGDRSALQSEIEINAPEGYIGTKMMPVVPVTEKAGSMAYATVTSETAAQTGRVAGVAPTATQISNSAHAWACTEIIERAAITPDEVKQMGGIDKADKIGFRWAMRSVLKAREALIAAVILGTKDATFDAAKLRTQTQTALQALRLYPGRSVLASSTMTLKAMVQQILGNGDLGPAFARIVTGANAAEAVLGLSIKAWLQGLALFVGVDEVLAGDDDVWNAGTCAQKFSIVKVDSTNDPLSHKYNPVLGKCITFLPDGSLGWELQGIADRTLINNFYDAKMWIDVETYNEAAVYTFDGVQP
ncbi:MAG: hypothetical protein FJ388_24505 [Verrucomicrobia bacterium]|nr:hypothetical protein [Verrucomicrobiota bacterium]